MRPSSSSSSSNPGLVFAETKGRQGVYVEEIVKGGNAEMDGRIKVRYLPRKSEPDHFFHMFLFASCHAKLAIR